MKKFRAFTASILASAMAMSMTAGFAAFADEPTPSEPPAQQTAPENITKNNDGAYVVSVTKIAGDKEVHTYEAYKIFDATEDGDKLTVTGWAAGVNSAGLLDALKADTTFGDGEANLFANAASAEDVAAVLSEEFEDNDENIQKFAEVVGAWLGTAAKTAKGTKDASFTDIEVGTAGYYLIKESDDSLNGKHSAKTRYILTPTNTINPKAKADFPEIVKKIDEDGELVDCNTASIGETVNYQLKSRVPDMTGYNKYFYIVSDSMYKGLTLDPGSFKIEINGTEIPAEQFYYKDIEDTKEDYDDFEIVLVDFIQYKDLKDSDIVITYDATLNENAKIGSEGNPNVVDLTFSNDPNHKYEGDVDPDDPNKPQKPDEPKKPNEGEPGDPMGKTPPSEVITYTAGIELIKVDSADMETKLSGAKFEITGKGVKTVVTYKTVFEPATEGAGEYYKLKDGTYTKTAPDDETTDKYESIVAKYNRTATTEMDSQTKTDENLTLAVDEDGILKIYGLDAGEYTITETQAPDGYILKKTPIVITIEATPTLTSCEWKYSGNVTDATTEEQKAEGIFAFKVANPKGVVLPGTGAFGSKLIYALGTIFTATGAAYMISKKKSKKDE